MAGRLNIPTYSDAVQRLNSTQTGYKKLEERRQLGHQDQDDIQRFERMRQCVRAIGYNLSDLNRLNVVHVAGTKGKGTTCAFVNSILQHYQRKLGTPRKIGLYTSPHLVAVRERIRINSEPISEEKFTRYFFEVWDALEASAIEEGSDPGDKPPYFRMLTLLSFHVFMREGVDTAIYEVGVGGEYDSTNVIEKPVVTGITTLGIDHIISLGDTIEKIAWHKAGIFKSGSPAFTVEQVPNAVPVLDQRAADKGVDLTTVEIHPALKDVDIRPAEDFQRGNASLAIALSRTVLENFGIDLEDDTESLPEPFVEGLESVVWRGRCETLVTGPRRWYLDGAHTEDSVRLASSWFGRVSDQRKAAQVLIFNQQSTRDSVSLVKSIHSTIYDDFQMKFQHAIFCTNTTYKGNLYKVDFVNHNVDPEVVRTLALQKELEAIWNDLDPHTETTTLPSIEDAIEHVGNLDDGLESVRVLVIGSFHLVGGALSILEGRSFSLARTSTV